MSSGSCVSSSTIDEMQQVPGFCEGRAWVSPERHLGRRSVRAELTRQRSVTHSSFTLHLMHHLSPSLHISVKLLALAWRRSVLLIFCTFGFCPTWLHPPLTLSLFFFISHHLTFSGHSETPLPAAARQTDSGRLGFIISTELLCCKVLEQTRSRPGISHNCQSALKTHTEHFSFDALTVALCT